MNRIKKRYIFSHLILCDIVDGKFLTFYAFVLAHRIEKRYEKVLRLPWLPLLTVSKDTKYIKCGTSLQIRMQYDLYNL